MSMSILGASTVLLFDIDGTLTAPLAPATADVQTALQAFRNCDTRRFVVGVVGGSDLAQAKRQLGMSILHDFDFVFTENGLVAHRHGEPCGAASLRSHYSEAQLQRFINAVLRYVAATDLPFKRGTFVEFRTGMINVALCGRNCTREEREAFTAYDAVHGVRAACVRHLTAEFADMDLAFSIGGQISFDVFPRGWDKTYCLRHLCSEHGIGSDVVIHFWGDKVHPGGNDHELFVHPRVVGHATTGPEDTLAQLRALFPDVAWPCKTS